MIKIFYVLCGLAIGGLIYVTFIEPNLLYKRRFTVKSDKFNFEKNIKAIHFTDVHLGRYESLKKFKRVVKRINEENPDIVFFTGDLIDNPQKKKFNSKEVAEILSQINAPLGKFAVEGNHEVRYDIVDEYREILKDSGFVFLKNDSIYLEKYNINIVGCGNSTFENIKNASRLIPTSKVNFKNMEKCKNLFKSDSFNIFLCHHPDVADEVKIGDNVLTLAGHSHGAQIRIPIIEKFYMPNLAKKYPRGLNRTADGALVHTSEGLGMTRFPFRFCSPPNMGIIIFEKNNFMNGELDRYEKYSDKRVQKF